MKKKYNVYAIDVDTNEATLIASFNSQGWALWFIENASDEINEDYCHFELRTEV